MTDNKAFDDCEKQRLVQNDELSLLQPASRQPSTLRERLTRHVFPCILLLLAMSILFRRVFVCHHHYTPDKYLQRPFGDEGRELVNSSTSRVALDVHIMSKCPDARDCLQQLVVPTMSLVSDKVDFKLSYIGSIDPDSDDVHCKHGPSECLGNIIQLCAADAYPDPKIYLGFANCMTSQYQKIPDRDLVEGCSMEHGIDFQKINSCISQEGKGMHFLRESVKHSQDVHVSTSCTIRLEGKVRCVRDSGKWSNCPGGSSVADLVTDIEKVYYSRN